MPNCKVCGKKVDSKREGRKHYRNEHMSEPEPRENRLESEQRDFHGEKPDTSGHNPQYLTDESDGSEPDLRKTTLFEHTRESDDSLTEYTDGETDE